MQDVSCGIKSLRFRGWEIGRCWSQLPYLEAYLDIEVGFYPERRNCESQHLFMSE